MSRGGAHASSREAAMKVTFWGTRGSIPVSGAQFVEHGGATTCLEVQCGEQRLIIDAGSGLAQLGRTCGFSMARAHFYHTHMHWDHVQGFPFCGSLFNPAARFDLHAVPREGSTLEQVLREQMTRPTFPITLDMIPATLRFHDLPTRGSAQHGDVCIEWIEVCHPSGSSAFRITHQHRSVVFTGDVEVRQGCKQALIDFARGADVLIMDAQYFEHEYASRQGFGHSTPEDAVEVAIAASIPQLVLTHHDPSHDDLTLTRKLHHARSLARAAAAALEVRNACDHLTLTLAPAPGASAPSFATAS